jgi:glycosyltransferase involved in cell wall biosynthesis
VEKVLAIPLVTEMRIAVWHNLPSGGGKRALHDQVRGLLRRGHGVEVWSPTTADREYLPFGHLVEEHVLPLRWREPNARDGGAFEKLRWALLDRHRNLSALAEHCRRCAEMINGGGFDLLLAHASVFLAVAPIGRLVRIPKVLYLQEPQRMLYEAMPTWPWIRPHLHARSLLRPRLLVEYVGQRVRLRHFEALARDESLNVRAYDLVLANSLFSRESMLRAYGVDARPCYLGVDTNLFSDRGDPRESHLIGVGSLTPAKNIEFVIRSVARLKRPRPRLVWIGNTAEPSYLADLTRLAAELQVDFEPRQMVSEAALVDALNRAAMMVYAPRLEPFGYAPLEANACGLPVIAVAEGGVRETVVDGVNGILVDSDEGSMARAIERLREDPDLARAMGQAGRRVVAERWSLEAADDRLERSMAEVVRGRA